MQSHFTHRFVMMEMVKLVVIVLLLLTNVFCQDVDNWRGSREENKWPNSEVTEDVFVRLIRKPGPRQMGKKDSGKMQPTHKRHKFQTFVGLMGKRSFEDEGFMGAAQRSEDY